MSDLAKNIVVDRIGNKVYISSECPTCTFIRSFTVSEGFPDFIGALYQCQCGTEYTLTVQIPHGDTL